MATGRPRVPCVDLCIDEPVKGHRGRSGKDHAEQNSDKVSPEEIGVWLEPGDGCGQQSEGQGENRMAESDQLQKLANSVAQPC